MQHCKQANCKDIFNKERKKASKEIAMTIANEEEREKQAKRMTPNK